MHGRMDMRWMNGGKEGGMDGPAEQGWMENGVDRGWTDGWWDDPLGDEGEDV